MNESILEQVKLEIKDILAANCSNEASIESNVSSPRRPEGVRADARLRERAEAAELKLSIIRDEIRKIRIKKQH